MRNVRTMLWSSFLLLLIPASARAQAWAAQVPPYGRPDAIVDLRTRPGVELVKGQWRYSDVRIIETNFRAPGPDLKPSGNPIKTYDYSPHAGTADFDDSRWETLEPTALEARRSTGKVCFNWYRINVTIPEKVGEFQTAGSAVAFEIVIDDYAEVWVNGALPAGYGKIAGEGMMIDITPPRVDAMPTHAPA